MVYCCDSESNIIYVCGLSQDYSKSRWVWSRWERTGRYLGLRTSGVDATLYHSTVEDRSGYSYLADWSSAQQDTYTCILVDNNTRRHDDTAKTGQIHRS